MSNQSNQTDPWAIARRAHGHRFDVTSNQKAGASLKAWMETPDAFRQHTMAHLIYLQIEAIGRLAMDVRRVAGFAEAGADGVGGLLELAAMAIRAPGEGEPEAPEEDAPEPEEEEDETTPAEPSGGDKPGGDSEAKRAPVDQWIEEKIAADQAAADHWADSLLTEEEA